MCLLLQRFSVGPRDSETRQEEQEREEEVKKKMMSEDTGRATRRLVLLSAAILLALVVSSGVALALTQTCTTNPCEGTSGADTLYERVGDLQNGADTIYGRGGDDDIIASEYEGDRDALYGGVVVESPPKPLPALLFSEAVPLF
jgi:hypothetical protein